jgi:hypothetical protein
MAGKSIHSQLLDGLQVKSRADGSVHTVKAEGKVVAEVCVGTRKTRVNFKASPKSLPKGLALDGKSKTWAGGGIVVDESNVAKVCAILAQLVAPTKAAPSKRMRSTAKAA